MKFLARTNPYFFAPLGVYAVLGGLFIIFSKKGDLVLWLNRLHSPWLDVLMAGITWLGSGWITAAAITFLLFCRFYYALLMLVSFLLTGATVIFLKFVVFSGIERPLKYFGENATLHLVEGVKVHSYNSFPSGHSAEAFAVFGMASFLVKKPKWGLLFFLLAFLVSLSRPYLVQHFFVDIYAGAALGAVLSSLVFYFFDTRTGFKNSIFWNRRLR